jgi:ABC-type amino acid transport substrate-binding protein
MKRAEQALVNGIVDFDFICREWLKNGDIGDDFVASIPLFEINEYVVTLKQNRDLYPTLDAIYGENIGTIGGYFYFDDDKFTRVDFLDENKLMKGLKHGRFNGIILDIETAKHWAKVNDVEIAFAALHTKGNLVLRLNKKHVELLDEINTIIARIKESGQLKNILDKYDVENAF